MAALGVAVVAALALIGTLTALAALASPAHAGPGDTTFRLKREQASPRTVFYEANRKANFRFEIGGRRARDVRVQVVRRRDKRVVRGWRRQGIEPGTVHAVRWNGSRRSGEPVRGGDYFFRVREQGGGDADRSSAVGRRRLEVRAHRFPVRGRHTYGDGYGAGRDHQGQDVFAGCGTKLTAARSGRVQDRGSQSSSGNYVVIDGRHTRMDYVYMHMRGKPDVRRGERVRTGERIGAVGSSGNATGCHLHFELWSSPGYWEGGSAKSSVTKKLRAWDRWS